MTLLQKYISKTILAGIALVLVLLVGLELFVLFVAQLKHIGQGNYTVLQAFIYALLKVPYEVYLFFPMACLLGCLLGLGVLASHSELIVMRAAGMSIGQIIKSVMKTALLLIFTVTLLGELIVPRLVHMAENRKAVARSGGQALRTSRGIWAKEGRRFIHVDAVLANGQLKGVSRYQFDNNQHLQSASFSEQAHYNKKVWQLENTVHSNITPTKITTGKAAKTTWLTNLSPIVMTATGIEPDEMSIVDLFHYVFEKHNNQMSYASYALAFWKRLFQPLASCVMMLLAIPFIFGPLRSATMGSRFLTGAVLGFSFYILNQIFGPISLVYQLPPVFAAATPTLLFAGGAYYLLRRVH